MRKHSVAILKCTRAPFAPAYAVHGERLLKTQMGFYCANGLIQIAKRDSILFPPCFLHFCIIS